LVGYAPKTDGEIKMDSGKDRQAMAFRNIRLPGRKDTRSVEFSAYAFNVDGIRSSTSKKVVEIPEPSAFVKGRAYLITVGVNAYEQEDFDLNFAANDARRLEKIVCDKLSLGGDYEAVIPVPLISDYEVRSGKRVVTEKTASKENFKIVFDLLAGRYVASDFKRNIPNADKIRRARPEDLVLISFSSHGFVDNN